jgi:hypothetical protein
MIALNPRLESNQEEEEDDCDLVSEGLAFGGRFLLKPPQPVLRHLQTRSNLKRFEEFRRVPRSESSLNCVVCAICSTAVRQGLAF